METIKIAHLYYDLMNLYGESGNIRVLERHLKEQNIETSIHFLTIDDEIDFDKYDIYYIGCGNDDSFKVVLNDIKKYKEDIKRAISKNKFFIVTGNALNLFGKYLVDINDKEIKCLDILDFDCNKIDFRIVGEQEFKFSKISESLIGFQNRDYVLKNVNEPHLFEVISGTGYLPKSNYEGIHKNKFYGTYLLGPILARNPYFTDYIVKEILKAKNLSFKHKHNKYEIKAYTEYKKYLQNK